MAKKLAMNPTKKFVYEIYRDDETGEIIMDSQAKQLRSRIMVLGTKLRSNNAIGMYFKVSADRWTRWKAKLPELDLWFREGKELTVQSALEGIIINAQTGDFKAQKYIVERFSDHQDIKAFKAANKGFDVLLSKDEAINLHVTSAEDKE